MASYQAIMIIVALFVFGLLYSSLYDAAVTIEELQPDTSMLLSDNPYQLSTQTQEIMDLSESIIKEIWKWTPLVVLIIVGVYGISVVQKNI